MGPIGIFGIYGLLGHGSSGDALKPDAPQQGDPLRAIHGCRAVGDLPYRVDGEIVSTTGTVVGSVVMPDGHVRVYLVQDDGVIRGVHLNGLKLLPTEHP